MIKSIGESIGESVGIPFYYQDFRSGWREGIEESKRLELYRQQYCGCIYSEKERFFAQVSRHPNSYGHSLAGQVLDSFFKRAK